MGLAVLMILMLIITQLLGSVPRLTSMSNKGQEADFRARTLFTRMALDFSQMLARPDVDYYVKNGKSSPGNDQIAFYSAVPGYYSTTVKQGAVSLVGYRVAETGSGFRNLERLGKGLSWLEDSTGASPVVHLPRTIQQTWPAAASATSNDEDWEELATGIFRLELFFLLKNGELSEVPWDASQTGHTKPDGLRDVAGIMVVVASVDPAMRSRVSSAEFEGLAAEMRDFNDQVAPKIGDLEKQWMAAADASEIPRKGGGSIKIHSRCFPINAASL